ncbi:putative DNA-binding domain-containing protein [Pokkaliibacter sp. CJK22405]|uniref:HvfC/BufC family peptide modification chaperone n=1 Tax=Pokkaliibacter sp. CJK22405 TaxID=3384615 RepID=UPI00398470DE
MNASLNEQQFWLLQEILLGRRTGANPQEAQLLKGSWQRMIESTEQFDASARLGIYQDGYRLRLLECLKAEFPVLHRHFGERIFRLFALGFLARFPSRHYSLHELGEGFAQYLADTRPACSALPPAEQIRLSIPEEIARLERAQAVSLRASGLESQRNCLPELNWFTWPALACPSTSQLIESEFDLLSYFQTLASQEDALDEAITTTEAPPSTVPLPANEPCALLVFRHQYRLNVARLTPWQAAIFRCLNDTTLDPSAFWPEALKQSEMEAADLLGKLSLWLPQAISSSMLMIDEAG